MVTVVDAPVDSLAWTSDGVSSGAPVATLIHTAVTLGVALTGESTWWHT